MFEIFLLMSSIQIIHSTPFKPLLFPSPDDLSAQFLFHRGSIWTGWSNSAMYLMIMVWLPFVIQASSYASKAATNGEKKEEDEIAKKYSSMWIRTLSSVWMIGGFVLIVYMGHLYIWAMIVVIQLYMAQELFTLARAAQREKQLPGFRLLNWYVCLFWWQGCLHCMYSLHLSISVLSESSIPFYLCPSHSRAHILLG